MDADDNRHSGTRAKNIQLLTQCDRKPLADSLHHGSDVKENLMSTKNLRFSSNKKNARSELFLSAGSIRQGAYRAPAISFEYSLFIYPSGDWRGNDESANRLEITSIFSTLLRRQGTGIVLGIRVNVCSRFGRRGHHHVEASQRTHACPSPLRFRLSIKTKNSSKTATASSTSA